MGSNLYEVNFVRNSLSDFVRNLIEVKYFVFVDEIFFFVDDNVGKEEGLLDNCGIFYNNCLFCFNIIIVFLIEKRRLFSSSF